MAHDKPYKILHFHFGKEEGAERFFVNLAQAFQQKGFEQRFVCRPERVWENEIRPLGEVYLNHYRIWSFSSPFFKRRIRKVIKSWQPDIILNWKPRGTKIIPKPTKPVVISRFGDYVRKLKSVRKSDYVVANTPDIAERFLKLNWQGGLEVISNFPRELNLTPISRAELDTPEGAFVICGAGRFVHRKGFDTLIKAVARHHKDAYLWLVGDGEENEALKALVHDEGIAARTRFTGWVSEAMNYVSASDLFIMPSRHEPLGNALLEAWATGVPTISTKSEGPLWFCEDGKNTLLVDIDDIGALGDAISRLKSDRGLQFMLSTNAQKKLESDFNSAAIVQRYCDLFAKALQEKNGS